MHLLSTKQYQLYSDVERLFATAREMELPKPESFPGKVMAIVKDEGSTRTRVSFEVAMKRLGGEVTLLELDSKSSIAKGETVEDTIRVMSEYVDVIVMRHSQEGMVRLASESSRVPVINAGDGAGEHPTQALLDLYTMQKIYPNEYINIMLVGDLLYSRTIHSLIHLLCLRGNCGVQLVSPPDLMLPSAYLNEMIESGVDYAIGSDLRRMITYTKPTGPDVVYMTRMQRERRVCPEESPTAPYVLDQNVMSLLSPRCVIMHPLPRCEEIPVLLDKSPQAVYWRQAKNGMFIRMALLYHLFKGGTFFPMKSL